MDETLCLRTSDGAELDARWRPAGGGPAATAVLCHPHPDYGGSMQLPAVTAWADALADRGVATLRFDFRQPGADDERRDDVRAAIDDAVERGDSEHVALVGWSYGADQALAVALEGDDRIAGVVAVAPTLRFLPAGLLERHHADGTLPVVAVVPERDQYRSPIRVPELLPHARVAPVGHADHFLAGHERAVADLVGEAVSDLLA